MARLEDYSFGRLTVDGQEHTRDLIVLPDRVVGNWWRREGHALAMEDLDDVLDELPTGWCSASAPTANFAPTPRFSRRSNGAGCRSSACPPTQRCAGTASSTSAGPRRRCT
jgi:hypothetical protein